MTKSEQLWRSLQDEEYRREFTVDVDTGLAFQIKLLREKNGWTQQRLAERAGSKQETISQWENPNYGSYTLKTLKSLATAFDVGLMVKFAPFSELVEWNANLTPKRLAPPSFTEEQALPRTVETSQPMPVFAATNIGPIVGSLITTDAIVSGTIISSYLEGYAPELSAAAALCTALPNMQQREEKRRALLAA